MKAATKDTPIDYDIVTDEITELNVPVVGKATIREIKRLVDNIERSSGKKFIRMESVAADKLLEAGGWAAAKQKGWVRVEGKEYKVKDGDVIVVRHG